MPELIAAPYGGHGPPLVGQLGPSQWGRDQAVDEDERRAVRVVGFPQREAAHAIRFQAVQRGEAGGVERSSFFLAER